MLSASRGEVIDEDAKTIMGRASVHPRIVLRIRIHVKQSAGVVDTQGRERYGSWIIPIILHR